MCSEKAPSDRVRTGNVYRLTPLPTEQVTSLQVLLNTERTTVLIDRED